LLQWIWGIVFQRFISISLALASNNTGLFLELSTQIIIAATAARGGGWLLNQFRIVVSILQARARDGVICSMGLAVGTYSPFVGRRLKVQNPCVCKHLLACADMLAESY